ncbi:adenosylcobinamide-phosphate synthase CbiB [Pseudohalocynthiibacter aestuariivivens]|jgi:adenosylcobinamide-phosphate synthase|uniref:Cobalamin biosynthesis protein CobD n=1 Tax=Pseudohalocynthiibacter aestuariivivens TaxID=1591409 RepID=A0ABV5JHC1_9RHOB|nr:MULTISPECIES: adenosylcobinamide-phosphate synthase CbiB [Pseudohalocynthiibacter]MBS9715440.1 cobalamin biosynthesis protein [Pseudohalocynthiibacter aestuariivivens]MCK0102614.1 adenosylcobinamide-phosphate synthase CbiB [Pseudohalocynthiibacter sp. F2068]
MNTALILALALCLDAAFGEPRWLWSKFPHPAVLMGRVIGWADKRFNAGAARKRNGTLFCIGLSVGAFSIGAFLADFFLGDLVSLLLAATLLAQKSLAQHVQAVGDALRLSLGDGRRAVAQIVGRDTAEMDETAVTRGAIESAAENFSDGVVAPAFWFLVAGLPGLLVYKVINTADSMIGYRNERYEDFGWASARLDDLLNWIPARLTAVLIAATYLRPDAWHTIRRDAGLHRSPNAGWPEAAMAVVLNVSLSGPRSYDGEIRDFPYVYPEGRRTAGPTDIDAATSALWRVWVGLLGLVLLIALF